jgi:hypothetical protein
MSSEDKPRFRSNWLTWTVNRRDRTFRVYVVEPRAYRPTAHADIFWAALRPFVFAHQTSQVRLEARDAQELPRRTPRPRRFDLLTFPEAFLDSETLLQCIQDIGSYGHSLGCAFHKENMTEANLLPLVTLKPTDKNLSLTTIQPLICSDVLSRDVGVCSDEADVVCALCPSSADQTESRSHPQLCFCFNPIRPCSRT